LEPSFFTSPGRKQIDMLTWIEIAYGATLSVIAAVALVAVVGRERAPLPLLTVAVGAFLGPFAWNAILRATDGRRFFTDAPIAVFPISWQDTGSGVFAIAVLSVLLGFGPLATQSGRRVVALATLGGLGALVVDIYLY
jgi:hypothetical protein